MRQDGLFYASVAQLAQALGNAEEDVRKMVAQRKIGVDHGG